MKYVVKASEEQLKKLYDAVEMGTPLGTALTYAGIKRYTYNYWIAVASVVIQAEQDLAIKQERETIDSGIDFSELRFGLDAELEEENNVNKFAFVKPTQQAMLKYKNNKAFRDFADMCYEIVMNVEEKKSSVVYYHLSKIKETAGIKGANTLSSQWILENLCPETFGKHIKDKVNGDDEKKGVQEVKVEFINPETKDQKERIKDIENEILGKGNIQKA